VHTGMEFGLDFLKFGSHPLADRLTLHHKYPFPFFPLMCVNPRKSNVSGLPSPLCSRLGSANRPNSPRFTCPATYRHQRLTAAHREREGWQRTRFDVGCHIHRIQRVLAMTTTRADQIARKLLFLL
jgi:hypothetical protein